MSFNISQFHTVLDSYGGVQRTNKFKVIFTPPRLLREGSATSIGQGMSTLEYFAEQTVLPGINFSNHDVRRYGYGPVEKRPIGHTFTDLNITFIADGYADIYKTMYAWMTVVSPFNMDRGINGSAGGPFLMSYKDEYVTDIRILVYNERARAEPIIDLVVRDAFPLAMADQQLNWSEMNNFARINMQFAYTDWYLNIFD